MTNFWDYYSLASWVIVGSIVGSFLNVVIYRIPRGISIISPARSFCPRCKATIPLYRNIPILTCLIQRRCSSCRMLIPLRYGAVEAVTGILFGGCYYLWGWCATSATMALFVCVLVTSSAIDIEQKMIPDALSLGGIAVGWLSSFVDPARLGVDQPVAAFGVSAMAAVGWSMLTLALVWFGDRVIGRQRVDLPSGKQRFWLQEDGDTATFETSDGLKWKWESLFFKLEDKIVIEGGSFIIAGEWIRGARRMILYPTKVICVGREWDLANVKSLSGEAHHMILPRQPLGMGDVKLIGCIGAFLGIVGGGAALFIGSIMQAVFSLILRRRVLPFAPALSIGAVAAAILLPWLRTTFGSS